jgi:transposase/transcriptional regulator with XRE-family HTH domain
MRGPDLSERDRLKIINYRYDLHYSQRKIAQKLHCNQSTVSRILRQHAQHHDSPQYHLRGRRKVFNRIMFNHLKNIIRSNDNITSKDIQRHLFHDHNMKISSATIRRYRRLFFHPVKEILIPKMKLDHYFLRDDYCMTHMHDKFHNIVFSDEKPFYLSHTSSTVWIEDDEPIPLREISSTHTKVMVWGGIWYHGRTELCIVEGNIDHKKHINILKEYLLPSMPSSNNFFFMHDNAKPHQPFIVEYTLRQYGIKLLEHYPPNSPDFNPIEHVWSWMSHYVNNRFPTDRMSLIKFIKAAWEELPQSVIQGCIDNLPTRLAAVHQAAGARLD